VEWTIRVKGASRVSAGEVFVITGPPGAGKTTVAALLAQEFEPSVHLHSDDFWHFIKRGWIAPYLADSHRQNEVVIGVLAQAAFGYAAGGYHVICDGIIGPWFLDVFRDAGRTSGLSLHYVVLRPDEATTVTRAVARGDRALTDPEPIRSLYKQFSHVGSLGQHVLDSTELDPAATAASVVQGLKAGVYLLS
jgi:chloramphenicol 3-O-phosphotransferase